MRTPDKRRRSFIRTRHVVTVLAFALAFGTALAQSSLEVDASITGGTGTAASDSFILSGCIDGTGIAGTASSDTYQMTTGCGVALIALNSNDDDGDSVPNEQEDLIGDGNGDGIADRLQSHVASVASAGVSVTAEVTAGNCAQFRLASAEAAELLPPHPRFAFPYGMVRISIACAQQGGTATVRILFPDAEDSIWPPFDYRSYGVSFDNATARYRSLPITDAGRAMIGEREVPYVSVELGDGLSGDSTPLDGAIDLLSGPAETAHTVRR